MFKHMMPEGHLERFTKEGCDIVCVGSRTIENGWHSGSDYDFLIYGVDRIPEVMSELGYKLEVGDAHYEPSEGDFNSWRKGNVNVIITDNHLFFLKFQFANNLAKARKLVKRKNRVSLFSYILYGVKPT